MIVKIGGGAGHAGASGWRIDSRGIRRRPRAANRVDSNGGGGGKDATTLLGTHRGAQSNGGGIVCGLVTIQTHAFTTSSVCVWVKSCAKLFFLIQCEAKQMPIQVTIAIRGQGLPVIT